MSYSGRSGRKYLAAPQIMGRRSLVCGFAEALFTGKIFRFSSRQNREMKRIDLNLGVIRDKQGIYSGLIQSQSLNQQLAVCYNSDGKLIVKIAVVTRIIPTKDGITVALASPDDARVEMVIPLDHIESIYPIRNFMS